MAVNFTNDVFISSFIINLFPDFMKSYVPCLKDAAAHPALILRYRFVGKAIPMVSKNKNILMPMVIPMLQERQRMMDAHGDDWEAKPVCPLLAKSRTYTDG